MVKAGIINVTGYAGSELVRILARHPEVEIVSVTGRSAAGKRIPEVLPHLWQIDLPITREIEGSVDIVFSALPSGKSAEVLGPMVDGGVAGIDIAADFRLHDAATFEAAYGVEHPTPHLLERAVYGLTELHREAIRSTKLVANPGCYPEAAILALAPAAREGIIDDDVIVDAKTGISGAGRGGLSTNTMDHFAEADENVMAYALDGHGHRPEIAQEIAELREADHAPPWAREPAISFLVPPDEMRAGLEATGFRIVEWEDETASLVAQRDKARAQAKPQPEQGKAALGAHIVFGADIGERVTNTMKNIDQGRIVHIRALAERTG